MTGQLGAAVISLHHDNKKKDDVEMIGPTDFEEAIEATGHKWFHYQLLLCCGGSLSALMTESAGISFIMPAAKCDFQMNSNDKGLMTAMCYLGMICSSHMWGFLADTRGRRTVLLFSLFMDGLCTILSSFMPYLSLYLLIRFFNGVFICGPGAVTFAYLGEFHSNKTRTSAIVYVCVLLCCGYACQTGIALLVLSEPWSIDIFGYNFGSWRVFSLINAMIPLSVSFLIWFIPESPKFLLSVGREHEALDVLRYMYMKNTGNRPSLYPVKSLKVNENHIAPNTGNLSPVEIAKSMWSQTWPLLKPPFVLNTFLACAIQFGLYASSNGFLLWIPDLFNRMAIYDELYPDKSTTICEIVSTLNANNKTLDILKQSNVTEECDPSINASSFHTSLFMGASSCIAYLITGHLLKIIPKKLLIFMCLLSSSLSGLGMFFAELTVLKTIFPVFFVVLSGMCISIATSVVIEAFPTYIRAMAVCLSLMMGRVGTVTSTMLVGLLIDHSCSAMIMTLSGIVFTCSLLSTLLPSPKDIQKLNLL